MKAAIVDEKKGEITHILLASHDGNPEFLNRVMLNGVLCDVVSGDIVVSYGGEEVNVVFVNGNG